MPGVERAPRLAKDRARGEGGLRSGSRFQVRADLSLSYGVPDARTPSRGAWSPKPEGVLNDFRRSRAVALSSRKDAASSRTAQRGRTRGAPGDHRGVARTDP